MAATGAVMYLFVQRWMCDPTTERGAHWRGLVLKFECWPVFLVGTILAIARAESPYIPTPKEAVRGRFFRLAWPQLVIIALFAATAARVIAARLLTTSEASLELTAQAVWGMLGFATLPVLMSIGVLWAAWQARHPALGAPWDTVDIECIGGDAT